MSQDAFMENIRPISTLKGKARRSIGLVVVLSSYFSTTQQDNSQDGTEPVPG